MQRARASEARLVLHRRSSTLRRCCGGALVAGGRGGRGRGGCWSLVRGSVRGFCRLQRARDGLEAGVVGRCHGDAFSSNGSGARCILRPRVVLFGGGES